MIPVVSVVLPVYNGEKYIRTAVESVFRQNVPLELIVIDDGSTDGTAAALAPYQDRDNFFYCLNKKRSGVAASRNTGVQKARGRYIAFLDADDWWEDGKLEAQTALLEATGSVLCSTGCSVVKEDGTPAGLYFPAREHLTYRRLLQENAINCSSVVLRRDAALRYPMEHDDAHEDYLCWLRILKEYGWCVGIDKPYLCYRLSAEGKSRDKRKSARMTLAVYRYMGYGRMRRTGLFVSYVLHKAWKYRPRPSR